MNDIYHDKPLQVPWCASPAPSSTGYAQTDVPQGTKRNRACRGENTRVQRDRMPVFTGHSLSKVFVLGVNGKPLTPTTKAHARKLLKGGVAKKVWSKFGIFGIQMLVATRTEMPMVVLGYDAGTKFEGFSIVVDRTNILNIKLDLPNKKVICKKLEKRRILRRARRFRNCRRRIARFRNRNRKGFIAPSQRVIINSRLKILAELCRIFPIQAAGIEDVRFNHAKHKWGRNFSTVEIGKSLIRKFFQDRNIKLFEFRGYETQEIRKQYGYAKTKDKSANKFTAHCSDSLALACEVGLGERIEPGPMLVVDDTYRFVRRQLHDTQPNANGVRSVYSTGTVKSLRKGLLIGTKTRVGQLCGVNKCSYRYYDRNGKRQTAKAITWVSSHFVTKEGNSPTV